MPDTSNPPGRTPSSAQALGTATEPLTAVSSMATKALLGELIDTFTASGGSCIVLQSAGGVDVARRIGAGEPFDLVALAQDALDTLGAAGHLQAGSARAFARSGVAVAVRAGGARPAIASEEAVRRAVLAARSIGVSTGPSGTALIRLFERWGIAAALHGRITVAPPGVAVGTLVASGEVELGFQQLSELMHFRGLEVVGMLPPPIEIITTFSAALGASARQPEAARALLTYLVSPATAEAKRRHGMEPPR